MTALHWLANPESGGEPELTGLKTNSQTVAQVNFERLIDFILLIQN